MEKAWAFVGVTLMGTVVGQLLLKTAVTKYGQIPDGVGPTVAYLLRALIDPLVLLSLSLAFVAALAWIAALSRLELSRAYPFMALGFVITALLSAFLLGEKVTVMRYAGAAVVAAGLLMVARG